MRDSARSPASAVSVGTESKTLLKENIGRIAAYITNDHATNVVYLALGSKAEANKGIRLNAAGGAAVIDDYRGEITAIATGASTTVTYSEV